MRLGEAEVRERREGVEEFIGARTGDAASHDEYVVRRLGEGPEGVGARHGVEI